jgi:hypothetical protein
MVRMRVKIKVMRRVSVRTRVQQLLQHDLILTIPDKRVRVKTHSQKIQPKDQ